MSDIEVSRVIAASPEALYDIVSDLPRMGDLSPENTGGMWVNGATGPEVGAEFRGTNSRGTKHWATTAVVERAERGHEFAFRVKVGPVKVARWSYRFEPVEGGTKVTETWDDMRNWMAKKAGTVSSGVSDRLTHNRETMQVTLGNLARAARATGAPGR
jgi:hypothetical protein